MPKKNFYLVKVVFPPNNQMKIPWRPAFVFFESDYSVKGIPVFTSHDNADYYRMMIQEKSDQVIETSCFGELSELLFVLHEHFENNSTKVMQEIPIYIDPTNIFCKGVTPDFKNIHKFLTENMPNEIPWAYELAGVFEMDGYSCMTIKDPENGQFMCAGVKGYFETREAIYDTLLTRSGTTEEIGCHQTRFNSHRDRVESEIKTWVKNRLRDGNACKNT